MPSSTTQLTLPEISALRVVRVGFQDPRPGFVHHVVRVLDDGLKGLFVEIRCSSGDFIRSERVHTFGGREADLRKSNGVVEEIVAWLGSKYVEDSGPL